MTVELIANEKHFFFEGGDHGRGVAFAASNAADVRGIDAKFYGYAIIDATENSDSWNSITIRGTLVTFHVSPYEIPVAGHAV